MAVFVLDITTDADTLEFEQTHELDGRAYLFVGKWNARDSAWRLSAYLTDGTPLALGRKVVVGVPLFRGEIDSRLPPGMLMAVDTTGADREPAIDEVGGRVVIAYYDAEEMAT